MYGIFYRTLLNNKYFAQNCSIIMIKIIFCTVFYLTTLHHQALANFHNFGKCYHFFKVIVELKYDNVLRY